MNDSQNTNVSQEAPVVPAGEPAQSAAAPIQPPVPPVSDAAVDPFQQQGAQVPPAGQFVPLTGGAAPAPQEPQNIPGMPLVKMTGGMKFGWAALGFLMGPVAILIAWLVNVNAFPHIKSDALKFSLFGFLAEFLIGFLLVFLIGMASCAAVGAGLSGYGYY